MKKFSYFIVCMGLLLLCINASGASFKSMAICVFASMPHGGDDEPHWENLPPAGMPSLDLTGEEDYEGNSILNLNGFRVTTQGEVKSVTIKWKVYKAADSGGSAQWNTVSASSDGADKWQSAQLIDLLNGLSANVKYVAEFYIEGTATDESKFYYNNGGNNYKVLFSKSADTNNYRQIAFWQGETASISLNVDGANRANTFNNNNDEGREINLGSVKAMSIKGFWLGVIRANEEVAINSARMEWRIFTASQWQQYLQNDGGDDNNNPNVYWNSMDYDSRENISNVKIKYTSTNNSYDVISEQMSMGEEYVLQVRYVVVAQGDNYYKLGNNMPIAIHFKRAARTLNMNADPAHYTWTGTADYCNVKYVLSAIKGNPANGFSLNLSRINNNYYAEITDEMKNDPQLWTTYYNDVIKSAVGTTLSLKENLKKLVVDDVWLAENLFNGYSGLDTINITCSQDVTIPTGCFDYCSGLDAINIEGNVNLYDKALYAVGEYNIYLNNCSDYVYQGFMAYKRQYNCQYKVFYEPSDGLFIVVPDVAHYTWTGTRQEDNIKYVFSAINGNPDNGFKLTLSRIDASKYGGCPDNFYPGESSHWLSCYNRYLEEQGNGGSGNGGDGYNNNFVNPIKVIVINDIWLRGGQFAGYNALDSITFNVSSRYRIANDCLTGCNSLKEIIVNGENISANNYFISSNEDTPFCTIRVNDGQTYQNFRNVFGNNSNKVRIVYNHITVVADDANFKWTGTDRDANITFVLAAIKGNPNNGFSLTISPIEADNVGMMNLATVSDDNYWEPYLTRVMKKLKGKDISAKKAIKTLTINNAFLVYRQFADYTGLDSICFNCNDSYYMEMESFSGCTGIKSILCRDSFVWPDLPAEQPCNIWVGKLQSYFIADNMYGNESAVRKVLFAGHIYVRSGDTNWEAIPSWEMKQTDRKTFELDIHGEGHVLTGPFKIADANYSEVNYGNIDSNATPFYMGNEVISYNVFKTDHNIPLPALEEGYAVGSLKLTMWDDNMAKLDFGILDPVGVVSPTVLTAEKARYDLNGRSIKSPQKGMNIIRKGDGKIVKELVR